MSNRPIQPTQKAARLISGLSVSDGIDKGFDDIVEILLSRNRDLLTGL
jgi:hypothetical protein